MIYAVKNGHVEVLRFLKDEVGLTVDDFRVRDNLPMILADELNQSDVIDFLNDNFGIL